MFEQKHERQEVIRGQSAPGRESHPCKDQTLMSNMPGVSHKRGEREEVRARR